MYSYVDISYLKISELRYGIIQCRIRRRKNVRQYRNSDSNRIICDDLATSYKNLVNFGPVTPEFKKGKYVHPLVDQQFGFAAPLLDLAGICTKFSGAITTPFCFTYALDRVTAMTRVLHAKLCHAFLVVFVEIISKQCKVSYYLPATHPKPRYRSPIRYETIR